MQRRLFVKTLAPAVAALNCLGANGSGVPDRLHLLSEARQALDDDDFWKEVRKSFTLNPGIVHLNCATLGATPRPVLDAIAAVMREIEGNPASNVFGPIGARMVEVQAQAAAFLGAAPDEVALTRNTTEGMNMVATGIDLQPGDEILTTNHEHPGGRVGWEHAAKYRGARIVEIEMPAPVRDKSQILQRIEDHLSPRTKVCSFSHVCTVTGLVMPLGDIATITRPRDILLVCDGAQAPGMLDVNVTSLGVDTYASSSHKWMLASKGSGLLYVRKEVQDRVHPVFLHSGFAPYTASSGTRNVGQILGHGVAMEFHQQIGKARVQQRCRELNVYLRSRLVELPRLHFITAEQDELASGIVSVSLESAVNRDVAAALKAQDIIVKVIPKSEYNGLRFSTHIYNNESELDRLAESLRALL